MWQHTGIRAQEANSREQIYQHSLGWTSYRSIIVTPLKAIHIVSIMTIDLREIVRLVTVGVF